jgi:TldD protein
MTQNKNLNQNTLNVENYLDKIKNYLETKKLNYYDIRLQKINNLSINIDKTQTKDINQNILIGIGIRTIKNKKLGFCSTTNLENYKNIIDTCINNSQKLNKKTEYNNVAENKDKIKFKHKKFETISIEEKTKELVEINKNALIKKQNNNIVKILQLETRIQENYSENYFVNPYSFIYEEKPNYFFYSWITGKRNKNIESSYERFGNVGGLELIDYYKKKEIINNNKQKLEELLFSKPCPAINNACAILDPDTVGLLAHEAIGHACEADQFLNNSSVLKKGMVLTNNKHVTIIDNPSIKNFGHFIYDDEGIKGKKKYLIKQGIVNEFITNIETATKLGETSNGGGRAESYASRPIPRMSNTYFEKGKDNFDGMLKNYNGYMLKGFAGGEVDPSIGTFMFGIRQVYKYQNGEIKEKYKQASISGNILTYLKNIIEIENKTHESACGFCGKDGQSIHVGDGPNPHIKINNITIGGIKHE